MTASPPHVLSVHPEAGSRDRAADELRRRVPNASVTSAASAAEALGAITEAQAIDCVVSAFDLPDGNGLDLVAEVRGERGTVPFVLFTDAGSEALASDAITAGVSEYVRADRPDPYRTLARRVRETLGRHGSGGAADVSGDPHRLLIDRTDRPMAVLENGRYRTVNDAYADLLGLSREQVLGSTDTDLFSSDVAELLGQYSETVLAEGERREDRIEATVDGEPSVLNVVHFSGPASNGTQMLGRLLRDVTDRVDRERLLRKERDRLEALANAVAHDARNAIQVIRGRARLAEESLPADAGASEAHLSALDSGADRLADLVESLESLRSVSDPVTDPVPVRIGEAARDAWATVAAPNARLRIRADPVVLGDPSRVRTLLENLFRNGVEHAPSTNERRAEPTAESLENEGVGGRDAARTGKTDGAPESNPTEGPENPSVTVTVDAIDGARGFAVSDDGTGVPEAERGRVLEFGCSLNGGTGLGLGIVSGIVDAHGWDIDLTESESGGARFEVRQETLDTFVS